MHVWLIKVGEPLPIDGVNYRPLRMGMLADALVSQGHDVTWWSSTLDHQWKRQRFDRDTSVTVRDGYELKLLHSMGYKSNVSLRRLLDHAQLGSRFEHAIQSAKKPDLIFCSYPTIELASVAVEYGRKNNVLVLLDVRDLWPDNFLGVIPAPLRGLAKFCMRPYVRQARHAFARCSAVVGISESYLQFGLDYAGRRRTEMDGLFPLGFQRPIIDENEIAGARDFLNGKGVDPTRTICWFAGMFGKTYDLETVIECARKMADRSLEDVQFVLSGAGETEARLKEKAQGLPNVVFTGRINKIQLAAMSEMADIGLMAYVAGAPQGLPNKLFEYLCAGLPIVSSLSGETEALLQKHQCGLTYRADDANSLLEAIETLRVRPEARRTMGENGHRIFDNEFSAGTVYGRVAAYLERVASGGQIGTPGPARYMVNENAIRAA